jgi:Fic family protein
MRVATPPDTDAIFAGVPADRLLDVFRSADHDDGRHGYVHWDKLRHLAPPAGLSSEEWWMAIKFARRPLWRSIPLRDAVGTPFVYAMPDDVLRLLHFVDQRCGGEIAMSEVVTADEQARRHYLISSLMEEAIRSSQLEGATTSRAAAKELLRSGREPQDRSERMILNNYLALQYMREEIGDELTPDAVLELQRILTDGTLDNPDAAGRLQRPDEERVAVYDRATGELTHRPPPAEQLPQRLQALCDFANETGEKKGVFIHPVVRGILLHFWLAYDHPFEDGNGRTARALFYWYMRARGYWLTEYLSISRILRKAPSQYAKSFLLTETDERDTTYFVLYQLHVLERAVRELHDYLRKKMDEVRSIERLIQGSADFNHRQLALLSNAVRDPSQRYTMQSHAASHNVTHETARSDLGDLTGRGLLQQRRDGRRYVFIAVPDLTERLKTLE